MSRIGKQPVSVPDGVNITIAGQTVQAKGPKGELSVDIVDDVKVAMTDDGIKLEPVDDSLTARSLWGMSRTLVSNIVVGVTEGFEKKLEINGVGYRAQVQGKAVNLTLGFSHDVNHPIPDGIQVQCPKPTEIVVTGIDKQKVGQLAAELRRYRPPEPYKGKGVKYADEYIFR
ncbi:MAG: 50S ribosomal protein L6, partial [Alphaproteobacteria bacterium]